MTLSRITVLIKQVPEWCRDHIQTADIKQVIKSGMNDGEAIDYLNAMATKRHGGRAPKIQVEGFFAG